MNKRIIALLGSLAILLVTFFAGFSVGKDQANFISRATTLSGKDSEQSLTTDFSPFWKAWSILNEKGLHTATDQDKVYGAISGLVSSLDDPYTVFFPPEENKAFNEEIGGSFTGVGMEIGMKDKILTVISPIKGSPAANAGIKTGDKILKIDETITNTITIDEAIKKIRGEKGTTVVLTIFRESEKKPREITLTRDTVAIPTLETKKRDDGIYVIQLYSFSANAGELFRQALIDFAESGSTKLILDLRGNPGGFMDAAIDMASWFLPKDKIIVSEDFGTHKDKEVYYSKGYDVFNDNVKMVILVDGGSASASEILAGALREHNVATLIGTQTFGKGSVQELVPLTKDTSIKVTVAKWFTPNGISISDHGITPDIIAEPKDTDTREHDSVLDKAVEFLKNK